MGTGIYDNGLMGPGPDPVGPFGATGPVGYNNIFYRKEFLLLPKKMHNGKWQWFRFVYEKIGYLKYNPYNSSTADSVYINNYSVKYIESLGYYTKEEAFLDAL